MTTLLFDTLKLSKRLQEKGQFRADEANALAEGISSASIDNLATKEDVKDLKGEIRADINSPETSTTDHRRLWRSARDFRRGDHLLHR